MIRRVMFDLERELAYYESGGDPDYLEEADEPRTLEEGRYPAQVMGVEECDDHVALYFEILTGDFAGEEVWCDTSKDPSPDGELRDWTESILGRPLGVDEKIDLGELLDGKRCEIDVHTYGAQDRPGVAGVSAYPWWSDPVEEEKKLQKMLAEHDPFDFEAVKRLAREAARDWDEWLATQDPFL